MKNRKLLHLSVFSILCFLNLNTLAQNDTVFYDGFSNNDKRWFDESASDYSASIRDGHLNLLMGAFDRFTIVINKFYLKSEYNFTVEAKFIVDNTGEYGFFWGAKDTEMGYCFTVNKNRFRTFKCINGTYIPLRKYTKCDYIDKKSNTLKIVREGDKVSYYINSEKIHEEVLKKLLGRRFGFILWNPLIDKTAVKVDYVLGTGKSVPFNLVQDVVYDSKPENLGTKVNSTYSELAPVISPDDKVLYFVRHHPDNVAGLKDQDIYYSNQNETQWSEARNFGKPLNNSSPNAVLSVTPDGNTLLVMHKYNKEGDSEGNGLSFSQRIREGWSVPVALNIKNYYNKANYNEFCLSNDGKTVLLTIKRDDTHGQRDVYVSFLQESGEWSEPLNLGPVVNTEDEEMSPFLASDGVTLYYSTDGFPGYGDNDIFMTKRLDDTWTNWSTPQNIGKPVNSSDWDAYYSISASGEYAYYVSSENSIGESDIFRIRLPKNARPNPVVLIYGKVLNSNNDKPVESTITYEILPEGAEQGIAHSNPVTGEYKIVLPYGKVYGFSAKAEGFIPVSENLDLTTIAEYKELKRDLYLVPIEVGGVIRLNNIFFDFNKSVLRAESFPELDRLATILKDYPAIEIEMAGHTDNVGSDDYNLQLSRDRAKSVKDYIVTKGIDGKRITSKGYGKTKPVSTNETEEGRQKNRRVEFTILKK